MSRQIAMFIWEICDILVIYILDKVKFCKKIFSLSYKNVYIFKHIYDIYLGKETFKMAYISIYT